MIGSVAAGRPQVRLISTGAATAAAPKDDSINSSADGWVGNNSLNVTLNQQGNHVSVSGFMGQGSVNLSEDINGANASISGTLSTPRGFIDVNVDVSSDGKGGKSFSGWLGGGNVSLNEDSSGTLFGEIGERNVDINRSGNGNNADFNGNVSGFGNDMGFVNVGVQSNKPNAALDAIIPLFGIIR